MVEEFDETGEGQFDLKKCVEVAKRHHWHFLVPFFLGWLIVWAASWFLPSRYKSGTLILVQQPTMPKDYVVPNINDDLQERLQSITQQILSRTRLMHIIDGLNLYAKERSQGSTPDDLVERMRKDIEIELVRDAHTQQLTSFNVYYTSYDAHTAQQVTSELTNLFISENLEVRQQQSEDTTKFLESQLEDARKTLADQEEKIRKFKDLHLGDLPGQLQSNLQILGGLQSQLQSEGDALNAARQQNVYLQSLLNQYRTLQKTTRTGDGAPVGLPAINQQLDKLKSQLAELSSHYTDRHPDVRKLKEQIAKTEKMRDQIIAELKDTASSPATANPQPKDESDIRESSPLVQLQSQLRANEIEIANRERSIAGLKTRIGEYQGRLNQEPVMEQELADLTRGYDQSKENYDDLLKKKNGSAMATSMELRQQGERFRILDPPSLPLKPDFPNRLKLCGVGLAIGLVLGAAVSAGAEVMDDRMYNEKQIKDLLPVKVVAEIPAIVSPLEESHRRGKLWVSWAMTGVVFSVMLFGLALSYLRG